MSDRKPTLRWRRQARESGLAGVVQGTLGHDLRYGDVKVATVAAANKRAVSAGWYWYTLGAEIGVVRVNTAGSPVASLDEAKAAAEEHVRRCLGLLPKKRPASA